jgi:hypothetical protein
VYIDLWIILLKWEKILEISFWEIIQDFFGNIWTINVNMANFTKWWQIFFWIHLLLIVQRTLILSVGNSATLYLQCVPTPAFFFFEIYLFIRTQNSWEMQNFQIYFLWRTESSIKITGPQKRIGIWAKLCWVEQICSCQSEETWKEFKMGNISKGILICKFAEQISFLKMAIF